MKKCCFLLVLLFAGRIGFGQSLEDITDMTNKKDYKNAKVAIDKYLSDSKNSSKADGWYFKGRIYSSLSDEAGTPQADQYKFKTDAFEAFKKNQLLDPEDKRLKLELYKSYLVLYFGFYDLGANQFNAKNYETSFESFKKSLEVKDYILTKKYTYTEAKLYPLDTALVLNTAVAATQLKRDDVAVGYYKQLTDGNVNGKGYEEVYEYLVNYYSEKTDDAGLQAILTKAKIYYPQNDYWSETELKLIGKKGDQVALFAKYDEMIAKDPNNFTLAYNYGIELYNSIYAPKDGKPANTDPQRKEKLTTVLKNAINNDKAIDATTLMANHLFNAAADYSTALSLIKGTKPDDVKKRNELKALSNKYMDMCIPYAESAVKYFEDNPTAKGAKSNHKIVLGYLSDIYDMKNNKVKAAEYENKRKALN